MCFMERNVRNIKSRISENRSVRRETNSRARAAKTAARRAIRSALTCDDSGGASKGLLSMTSKRNEFRRVLVAQVVTAMPQSATESPTRLSPSLSVSLSSTHF